ncbi:MAG TPA: hypothetical protein VKE40_24415 [Gemmataceae bacterium]|nr:hypothetical protein [Gemmataceae bacterium]
MFEHSTSPPPTVKSERPQGSPLFSLASGCWAKKIRRKLEYFGRGSHDDALADYNRRAPDVHAGRRPRDEEPAPLIVYTWCANFLSAKLDQRDKGDLSERMFAEYGDVCKRLIKVFGKGRPVSDLGPDAFARLRKMMAKTWGPVRLAGAEVE